MNKCVLWSFVAMVAAGVASADAYRWVDEKGNVVFSQKQPTGEQKSERVPLPTNQNIIEEKATTPEAENTKNLKKPATAQDLDPAVRKDYCDRAKQNVELLENTESGTAFVTEDKTIIKLTDEERAQRLQQAKEAMDAYCE